MRPVTAMCSHCSGMARTVAAQSPERTPDEANRADDVTRAQDRRHARDHRRITTIGTTAGLLTAAALAMGWHGTWAPTVQPTAVALPTPQQAAQPAAGTRGFPTLVRPTLVPTDVTVWSQEDGPVTFYGRALPTRTAAPETVVRDDGQACRCEDRPEPAAPGTPTPPPAEETQAGKVVGLPPVVVEPEPPAAPAEPAEPTPTGLPTVIDGLLEPAPTDPEPTTTPAVTP